MLDQSYLQVLKTLKKCWQIQHTVLQLMHAVYHLQISTEDKELLLEYIGTLSGQVDTLVNEAEQTVNQHEERLDNSPALFRNTETQPLISERNGHAPIKRGSADSKHTTPPVNAQNALKLNGSVNGDLHHAGRDINIEASPPTSLIECKTCHGQGSVAILQTCGTCRGEGATYIQTMPGAAEVVEVYGCRQCGGKGMMQMAKGEVASMGYVKGSGQMKVFTECKSCSGRGKVRI